MEDTKGEGARAALCAMRLDPGALAIDLDEMARRPLPGGIAAAAAAAAMGAALIAKSVQVALRRAPGAQDRPEMEEMAGRAGRRAAELLGLARADTEAYRCVLKTRAMAADDPTRRRAWLAAVEVPLRLAELALAMEEPIPALFDRCPTVVHIDLQIGARLLQAASEGGRLAAEENLEKCEESDERRALWLRLAALKETDVD